MKQESTYNREAYLTNRDKFLKQQKEYNKIHSEEVAARANEWNERNKELIRQKHYENYHSGLNAEQRKQRREAIGLLLQLEAIANRNILNKAIYKKKKKELHELYDGYVHKYANKRTSLNKEKENKKRIMLDERSTKGTITKCLARIASIDKELALRKERMLQFKTLYQQKISRLRERYLP